MNWRKPLIYSLLYLSGSKIPAYLKEIRRMEQLSPASLENLRKKKLTRLLLHAHKNVPYYHNILEKAKVVVNGSANLENFNRIPILTKDIIRKEKNSLCSEDYKRRKPYKNTSGGSTGEPVGFIQDRDYSDWNIANKIYYKSFGGQDVGQKELRLWGSERDVIRGSEKPSDRLKNWLYNRKDLNAFYVKAQDFRQYVKIWNSFKPDWIEAYVESILNFAEYVQENNIVIHQPKGILTSANTLYPETKKIIEQVFSTRVYNRYGSREVGDIACSCNEGQGLHISSFNNSIELVRNESGISEIIVTNLNNYAMPLIRYQIGDIGVKSANKVCACGRPTPLLENVEGRITSYFINPEGSMVSGAFFRRVLFERKWIRKYQVIQKDYDYIQFNLLLNEGDKIPGKDREEITRMVRHVMGEGCRVSFQCVDEIKPGRSGKFLYTICEIP